MNFHFFFFWVKFSFNIFFKTFSLTQLCAHVTLKKYISSITTTGKMLAPVVSSLLLLFSSAWHTYTAYLDVKIGHISFSSWQLSSLLSLSHHHHPFHSYRIFIFFFHWNAFSDENKNNFFDSYWLIRDPSLSLFLSETYTHRTQVQYSMIFFAVQFSHLYGGV